MSDRDLGRESRRDSDRERTGDQEKSTLDKIIDKAQEKGVFDKAERMLRDKMGGKNKRR